MGLLLAIPFLLVLVIFALSNTQAVPVAFWPFDYTLVVPLSVAVLVGMGAAFLFGGLLVWGSAVGQRRRARRAEGSVRALQSQVADLKSRLAVPSTAALPPPMPARPR